jgi:hypothetical protein
MKDELNRASRTRAERRKTATARIEREAKEAILRLLVDVRAP